MVQSLRSISPIPLSSEGFAEFGDVLAFNSGDSEAKAINQGQCIRLNDLADLDFDPSGRMGVSLFHSTVYTLPHRFDLMERHPYGPQVFFPLDLGRLLIVVALDNKGIPIYPQCFISSELQGINIHRGVWHGVLTPVAGTGKVIVFDWIGGQNNLEEYTFKQPWQIEFTRLET